MNDIIDLNKGGVEVATKLYERNGKQITEDEQRKQEAEANGKTETNNKTE
jgi:hypothetical protein